MAKYEDSWCQEAYDRGFKEGRAFEKDQLTKAKEIIKTFLVFAEAFGYSPSIDKFISDAEQFLKDCEVEK
jgi:hypothetical protein